MHHRPLPGRRKNVMSLAVGVLELSLDFITATSKRVDEVTGLITAACYSTFFRQVFFLYFFLFLGFFLSFIDRFRIAPTPTHSTTKYLPQAINNVPFF